MILPQFFSSGILLAVAAIIGAPCGPAASFAAAAADADVVTSTCSRELMLQTIGDLFGNIDAGTMLWSARPVPQSQCLQLDYSSNDVSSYINQLSAIFGINLINFSTCAGKDPDAGVGNTCKAVQALIAAFGELKGMGCAPIFRNYLPAWTDWHQNSTACVPGSFDPETKEFSDPNGCNAFAVCDILTTVLTLSANQARTGTCGTTAMLTVLSRSGPVRALQLATELVWTGTTRFLQTDPCPYIYDFFPGVQPLPDPGAPLEDVCGAIPTGDCNTYYNMFIKGASPESSPAFIQTPGIEFMFTEAFATSYFQDVTGGCTPEGSQLIKPDFSNSAAVQEYQGTTDAQTQHYCRGMVDDDYSCEIVSNVGPINPWKSLDTESAKYWMASPNMVPQSADQLKNAFSGELPFGEVTNALTQRFIEGLFCSVDPSGSLTITDILGEAAQASVPIEWAAGVPRTTESMLNEMCAEADVNEQGVVVSLNSGPLDSAMGGLSPVVPEPCVTGSEPYCSNGATGTFPVCDHAVVLLDCDIPNNVYRFWTWATVLTLSKEILVADETTGIGGSICSFMVGKPSGGNQAPLQPTPCDPGVCHLYCDVHDPKETEAVASEAIGTGFGDTSTATPAKAETDSDVDTSEAIEKDNAGATSESPNFSSGRRCLLYVATILFGVLLAV